MLIAIGAAAVGWGAAAAAPATEQADKAAVRYVAPRAQGDGGGRDAVNAAQWTDEAFWQMVGELLEDADVEVTLRDGTYYVSSDRQRDMRRLSLGKLGHPVHRLTVRGMSPDGVTITRHPEDGTSNREGSGLLTLNRCQNITLRHLHFTAPHGHWMSYATQFDRCRDLVIDSCTWIDMPNVHHAATGAQRPDTLGVVYQDCKFIRIGRRSGAHMAYNAYASRGISYINCHFEDCAGDYIRFRSGADFGVVAGCTFRSTGTYTNTHMPFISMPQFNNVDPGNELFGTHFLIFNNEFIYDDDQKPETRVAIRFLHRGFDPPERRYLLDAEEAERLASGTRAEKRALLRQNLGIDADRLHVYGNEYTNVHERGVYQPAAAYGAQSRGGDGSFDISDTFNAEPVVTNSLDAAEFFQELHLRDD